MARLQTLKLPKGVEIDEVSNDNFFTHPSSGSVPTTLAVKDYLKDYLRDEIDKHDQAFWPDGLHRNAIINGNFDVWQRGTSFTFSGNSGYHADRWHTYASGGSSVTITREPFDPRQPGVLGNSAYYLNMNITSIGTLVTLDHKIEDVRTFAGQRVTLSFYAMSSVPVTNIIYIFQNFGTGGSSEVTTQVKSIKFNEMWQKYTVVIDVPSISGKTVGDGSYLAIRILHVSNVTNVGFAQVQLNVGDKPLPFSPRPYAEELALCQRYWRSSYAIGTPPGTPTHIGVRVNYPNVTRTNHPLDNIDLGNSMRTTPTVTIYSRNDGAPGYVYDYTDQKNVPVKSMIVTNNSIHLKIDSVEGHEYGFHWAANAEL